MHIPFGRSGGQEAVCLKLDLVNGWLFTIDTSRIKDSSVREKVIVYGENAIRCFPSTSSASSSATTPNMIAPNDEQQESESSKLRLVSESRHVFGVQAAQQLWVRVGLPLVPAMLQDPRQLSLLDQPTAQAETSSAA